MLDTLLKPASKARIDKLIDEIEACYQVNEELTHELLNLESKSTVRFSNQNQHNGLGGGGSNVAFYTMLPDSFRRDNQLLIDNTQASEMALRSAKSDLVKAKWDALNEISEAAKEQYLMAANVIKQNHAVLYGLANREGDFKSAIHCWNKLHIPCGYGSLKTENAGQAGEPVIINQQLANRNGQKFSDEVTQFLKAAH